MPARIVIHKSSQFRESEREGFPEALNERGIWRTPMQAQQMISIHPDIRGRPNDALIAT